MRNVIWNYYSYLMMIVAQQNGADIANNISNSNKSNSSINKSNSNISNISNSNSNCDNLKSQRGEKQQSETSTICPGRPNRIIRRQKLAQLRGVAAGGVRLQFLFLLMICSCIGKFGKIKWVSVSVYVRWFIDNYRCV